MLLEASHKMTSVEFVAAVCLACAKAIRNKTEAPDWAMIANLLPGVSVVWWREKFIR